MTNTRFISVLLSGLAAIGCGGDDSTVPPADAGGLDTGTVDGGGGDECEGATDGTPCAGSNICVGEACVASTCGDGYVDGDAGELCDDANAVSGDGCEPDTCTPSCTMDEDCDDGLYCNGLETCNTDLSRCQAAGTDPCDDSDPCTDDSCDEELACANDLIDADGDTYAPATCTTSGLMGDDCNDSNFTVYPGADELCDTIDNDCDGTPDDGTVTITCYRDADDDTYGDDDDTVDACSCPTDYIARGGDCDDSNADVNPSHSSYETVGYCPGTGGSTGCTTRSFDWNCSGSEERLYGVSSGCMFGPPGCSLCACMGSGFTAARACGQSGSYRSCGRSGLSACTDLGTEGRVQPCR
jgi:cysteine-rich repeat protein